MSGSRSSGRSLRRVDAAGKVTGSVHYGTDRVPAGLLHAVFVVSTVPKASAVRVDPSGAEAAPGVRLVLAAPTPGLASAGFVMGGGHGFQSVQPLMDDEVRYRGQPVALVVADSFHQAVEGAAQVSVSYDCEPAAVRLGDDGTETVDQQEAIPLPMFADVVRGDAETALSEADVVVEGVWNCPTQAPSPMELIGCVVEWDGDDLTIHEGTQNANALRFGTAAVLGIDPAHVQVISPFAGGAFGNKNSLQCHTALAAYAARELDRPVKMVLDRRQMYLTTSFRPASQHRLRLGATNDGRLVGAVHEVDQQTSRSDLFPASYTELSSSLYAVPDFRGHQRLVRTDTQTPGYMRAPHEHPSSFVLESAMDELAARCEIDPVRLRVLNDTATDPTTGHPFSSRSLVACLERGAERFGWWRRDHRPGSMRSADGQLVGWGVAAGAYPGSTAAAVTRATVDLHGHLRLQVGGHEMGQGLRTAVASAVVDDLGVAVDDLTIDVGDTSAVPQHLTAGAWGTATALRGVAAVLAVLRRRLRLPATGEVDLRRAVADLDTPVEVEAETFGPGQDRSALDQLHQGGLAISGPEYPEFSTFSYVAHFVEVRVEPTTARVRVHRVASTIDCGRVVNRTTAESQVRGGVVWGLGAALREAALADPVHGGFVNDNLADYVVPVMADLPEVDVDFIDEPDTRFSPTGVKTLGEVVMVGVAAAISNAVQHATGTRHHHLPIRVEDVLPTLPDPYERSRTGGSVV